jgi:hypothetical protein
MAERYRNMHILQVIGYRELLGVFRCLHAMVSLCEGKFVVFQVYAKNILEIVNHGTPRLKYKLLAGDMLLFGVEHRIALNVELVPREENVLTDELSKLIIPDDSMMSRAVFHHLEERFGLHTVRIFASGSNNRCEKFYSLHRCRIPSVVHGLAIGWGVESA